LTPSKAAGVAAAFLQALAGAAGTEIVAAELLDEFLVAVNDANAPLDLRFGRESLTTFAHPFESRRPV
jgi:hypothetical protein